MQLNYDYWKGYTGVNCQTVIAVCASNPCVNGICNQLRPNVYTCICNPGIYLFNEWINS